MAPAPKPRRFRFADDLLRHWDGYAGNANNFFVYVDPSPGPQRGKMRFLPWGNDQVMQRYASALRQR